MTKKLNTFLCIIAFLLTCTFISAQSSYSANRFLIVFEPDATQQDIDLALEELNCKEIWISPISQTRLWEVNYFPFLYPPTNTVIYNINEESSTARTRAKVNEAGLDYQADKTDIPSNGHGAMDCYGNVSIQTVTSKIPVHTAIFDTGFTYPSNINYPDFYFGIDDYIEYNYLTGNPIAFDGHGHGTHIASVIAHLTNLHSNTQEAPPVDVTYNMSKTFDDGGNGYLAEIIYAFEWAVAKGFQIVNFSWSIRETNEEAYLSPLRHSLEKTIEFYPILIICAAGNNGINLDGESSLSNWPAAYGFNHILSVASYNCKEDLALFSNYGQKTVDIAAPGINIPGLTQWGMNFKSGTSQSAAIITGVATALATNQNNFDALEIKCAIMNSATTTDDLASKLVSGGYINAEKAGAILGACNSEKRPIVSQDNKSTLFPNPTNNGIIHYQFQADTKGLFTIHVYDQLGQVMLNVKENAVIGKNIWRLDLSTAKAGIYTIEHASLTQRITKRFMRF